MQADQTTSHAGCDGLRADEARAGRACGLWGSLNARTNRQRLAGPRRPSPRQRASQSRRLPLAAAGCCHRICIPLSLVKAPAGMSGFVPFDAGLVCSNLEPDTKHWRPSQAAWPNHSGLMFKPTNEADLDIRSTLTIQDKTRQKTSQRPDPKKIAARSSCDRAACFAGRFDSVYHPSATATCMACF